MALEYRNTWYVTKTLLGGSPDINRRKLYRGDDCVMVFNADMRPWPEEMDRLLDRVAEILNVVTDFDSI